ncbi:MAG: ABC transporter substrate-binding protein [Syntrophales bacterium]|nr:ABC transporter substrate-binding protein [Syntrophales bacterium]MDY0045624.1 ABC transporter substrate-binding protein [Syntrophales bacterium]
MKGKSFAVVFIIAVIASALAFGSAVPSAKAQEKPIVISYVCDISQEAGSVPASWMKLAARQINDAGGISGRPLELSIQDCKGQTSLAVEAYVRALVNDKANFVIIYGRSEIALACEAKAAEMFDEYPHIFIASNCGSNEITDRIVDDYEKWKFVFRDNCAQLGRIKIYHQPIEFFRKHLGLKKIALLREDLLWTQSFFKGVPATEKRGGILGLPDYARSLGMEVVYEKAVKYKAGMYSPILEAVAASGAECCLFVAGPGTGMDDFVKQWVDSSARDMHMSITSGPGANFWQITGGKALGVMFSGAGQVPLLRGKDTPEIPDVLDMAKKHNLTMASSVVLSAYPNMFFIKKVVEKAGGVKDIDALIKAMETTEIMGPLGLLRYEMTKIPPFFHQAVFLDPKNPSEYAVNGLQGDFGQFQEDGNIVLLAKPYPGVDGSPNYYKSPAELRKMKK